MKSRLIALGLMIGLLAPTESQAYVRTGNKWPQGNPTVVRVTISNSIPSAWAAPFGSAMATWWSAGARFRFEAAVSSGHNVALRYLTTNALAVTYIREGFGSKTTSDRDTDFNQRYSWDVNQSPNKFDAQAVFTHELGHWLTLGDLYGTSDYWKTMYGITSPGLTYQRTLESDDINGIRAIYGSR